MTTFSRITLLLAIASAPVLADPPEVKTVAFYGESVDREMKYNVILPAEYASSSDRYPVLYLLHGLTSNYTAWAKMGVPKFATSYDFIVIMPDVGNTWYVNWADVEDGQKHSWEDFIIKDLITHVDSKYRTLAFREGRAINGLSMGGYGAITLGLRHPDMFCSIGSHSGALAYAKGQRDSIEKETPRRGGSRFSSDVPNPAIGIEGFSSPADRTPKGQPFKTVEDCDAYDPFKLVLKVPKEQLPHIYLDCGTEDRLIASAREFSKLLIEHDIPFTYAQSPGAHLPGYWAREVGQSMGIQGRIVERQTSIKERQDAQ